MDRRRRGAAAASLGLAVGEAATGECGATPPSSGRRPCRRQPGWTTSTSGGRHRGRGGVGSGCDAVASLPRGGAEQREPCRRTLSDPASERAQDRLCGAGWWEQFLVLMPGASLDAALPAAERLCEQLAADSLLLQGTSANLSVTRHCPMGGPFRGNVTAHCPRRCRALSGRGEGEKPRGGVRCRRQHCGCIAGRACGRGTGFNGERTR